MGPCGTGAPLLEKGSTCNDPGSFFEFLLGSPGQIVFEMNKANSTATIEISSGTNTVVDGLFHHVAMVRQGDFLSLFVDGRLATNFNAGAITRIANNSGILVGADYCNRANFFVGDLDELDLWNRALSQAEIQTIYDAASQGKYNTNSLLPNFQVSVDGYSTNTIILPNFSGGWQQYTNSFIATNTAVTIELAGNTLARALDDIELLQLPAYQL